MKTISVKLPESLDKAVAQAARRRGRTKSALVREALEAAVREERTPGARRLSCLDLAGDLVGCVSGPGDLSNKKKHLKGYGQ